MCLQGRLFFSSVCLLGQLDLRCSSQGFFAGAGFRADQFVGHVGLFEEIDFFRGKLHFKRINGGIRCDGIIGFLYVEHFASHAGYFLAERFIGHLFAEMYASRIGILEFVYVLLLCLDGSLRSNSRIQSGCNYRSRGDTACFSV